jgi:Domain of unknown function (DUF222)
MSSETLATLSELIDEVAADDTLSDPESIKQLLNIRTRIDAETSKAVAAFDASGDWAIDGAQNAAVWVATVGHLPRGESRGIVRRGRALRHLPAAEAAWRRGDINGAHVDLLVGARKPCSEEAMARDEEMLVGQAQKLRFEQFAAAVCYWDQLADPDGTEEKARARQDSRDVYLTPSISGMFLGKMTLDEISGTIVSGELQRLETEMFAADWAKAKEELGRDPKGHELSRTPAQRRADALVEMAMRSASAPADGQRPAPLFSILIDWPTFSGRILELSQGIVVSPGSVVPWLEYADIERAVFGPGGRIEVGIKSRFFTGATRRALELRDRQCTHPFCDQPPERCQGDHVEMYSAGGETTQENGRLLCGFHNRLRNQRPPPDG